MKNSTLNFQQRKHWFSAKTSFVFFVFLLWFQLFQSYKVHALVNTYSYAQSTGTYTALTGTTLCTGTGAGTSSSWYQGGAANVAGSGIPLGFNFVFDCVTYTSLGVHTNGFIWFGSGTPGATALAPIGNASANLGGSGTINGIVSAYGGNTATMQGSAAGSYIRYTTTGTSPNRIFKVEWRGYRVTGGSGNATLPSYQLWLYETTNVIEQYCANQGTLFILTAVNGQIGIRGLNNTDVRCLSTPCAANTTWNIPTSTTTASSTVAIDGVSCNIYCGAVRKFTWTPTASCCTPPGTQASGNSLGSGTSTSQVLNWSSTGSGDAGVLVTVRPIGASIVDPSNITSYTANASYGSGSTTGANNYVVYSGLLNTVNVTNLLVNTSYAYAIYSFNTAGPCYLAPPITGTFTTADDVMTYNSSNTVQVTGSVALGSVNQPVIQIQVNTGPGTLSPLTISSLTFNTNGTTSTTDILSARIYYTGTSSTFSTATAFGSTITSFPGGSTPIPVSGSQILSAGINYFWVAYDISIGATVNNVVDAECTSINIGSVQTPSVTAPGGNRPIAQPSLLSCAYTLSTSAAYATITGLSSPAPVVVVSGVFSNSNYSGQSIGFSFEFNGLLYSTYGINSNGFIWFGSGSPAANTSAPIAGNGNLGGSGTIDGIIAACGTLLKGTNAGGVSSKISTRLAGTAPNRTLTIQWENVKPNAATNVTGNNNRIDFQIILYEHDPGNANSSRVDLRYIYQQPFGLTAGLTYNPQVGFRGFSNSDYYTRSQGSGHWTTASSIASGAAGVSNSATGFFNGSNAWVNSTPGIQLSFLQNAAMPFVSPSPTATNVCPATDVTLSTSSTAPSLQWYKDNASIALATSSSYVAAANGGFLIAAMNGSCGKVSAATVVSIDPCLTTTTWTGAMNTDDWNDAGNWTNGVPTAALSAIIPDVTAIIPRVEPVISTGANGIVKDITISSNATLQINSGKSLSIANNGFFDNSSGSNLNYGTGTIIGIGLLTVQGSDASLMDHLLLNGATTIVTQPSIIQTLTMNSGSSVDVAPVYGSSSTLIYNAGGIFNVGNEWTGNTTTAGSGTPHHVEILNGTTLQLPASNRGMGGTLTNNNSHLVMNAGSGSLSIGGDYLRSGVVSSFVTNNQSIIMARAVAGNQSVAVSGGLTEEIFYDLELAPVSGDVILNSNIQILSSLSFTAGSMQLNGNSCTLGSSGNNGSISGYGASNYFKGGIASSRFIRYTTTNFSNYDFPLGDATHYTPIRVEFFGGSMNVNSTLSTAVITAAHPQLGTSTNYLNRYWNVEPANIASNTFYAVQYTYADADIVNVEANLKPYKYNAQGWLAANGSGADFEMGTGSVNPSNNTVSWSGLHTFSDFTANGDGSPLPITLLDFSATANEMQVNLEWSTLSEVNNDYFTIERSKNGERWEIIGNVNGNGNTNDLNHYQLLDKNPYMGINYYRLKQTDWDGKFEYSGIRAVDLYQLSANAVLKLYPNPAGETIWVETGVEIENFVIYDATGSLVMHGSFNGSIDIKKLPVGLYFIEVGHQENTSRMRFIKN
jgi:hypothetical protein